MIPGGMARRALHLYVNAGPVAATAVANMSLYLLHYEYPTTLLSILIGLLLFLLASPVQLLISGIRFFKNPNLFFNKKYLWRKPNPPSQLTFSNYSLIPWLLHNSFNHWWCSSRVNGQRIAGITKDTNCSVTAEASTLTNAQTLGGPPQFWSDN